MEKAAVAVAEGIKNPLNHTVSVLNFLKLQTDTVVLFYSGGKDSIVLLDLLYKSGFKIKLVYMYLVPDLEHVDKYLKWAKSKYNVELYYYQHWVITHYIRDNYYRIHETNNITLLTLSDIVKAVKTDLKVDWIITGMKQADSLNRRLMLKPLFMSSIEFRTNMVYPLSIWKKNNCMQYIKQNKLPMPISYEINSNSSGFDLNKDVLMYLKHKYPKDLKKVFKVFPLAETLLL